jgi:hypothetical protein
MEADMALRDRLARRVQPLLEPGEQVHEVMMAQTGPNPYLAAANYQILLAAKHRIIVVTDRAVVVVRAGSLTRTSAKEVIARLPRSTRIGPLSGRWAKTEINGEEQWINKRFHGDAARADAGAPPPAPSEAAGA